MIAQVQDPLKQKLNSLSPYELLELKYDWEFRGLPHQLEPEDPYDIWLNLRGRGNGKTFIGSQWTKRKAYNYPGCEIGLVGRTSADFDIMIHGPSGILTWSPPSFKPSINENSKTVRWPNGSRAKFFSSEVPASLRGPQFHFAWGDEFAYWKYPDTYDMLQMCLRLGKKPQMILTCTPRPLQLIKDLMQDEGVITSTGTTFDNPFLSDMFMKSIERRYGGTKLGEQELYAKILEDTSGALWTWTMIEETRLPKKYIPEEKQRNKEEINNYIKDLCSKIVIAVDPAVSNNENSDLTGIVVAGKVSEDRYIVLEDISDRYKPNDWAKAVVYLYDKWEANKVVAETNQGGDLVENNIYNARKDIPVKKIHAKRSKYLRAEPIVALYEQNKVKHATTLGELENQMTTWVPSINESPDRIDALVYALTELSTRQQQEPGAFII